MNELISIEKTAEKILTRAVQESASDIHIFFAERDLSSNLG
ncbi:hypothetical protein [Peribacillus simplex]